MRGRGRGSGCGIPEGFKAISRWLSEERATPPEPAQARKAPRRGARLGCRSGAFREAVATPPGSVLPFSVPRGCRRCAPQPPANGCDPFGMGNGGGLSRLDDESRVARTFAAYVLQLFDSGGEPGLSRSSGWDCWPSRSESTSSAMSTEGHRRALACNRVDDARLGRAPVLAITGYHFHDLIDTHAKLRPGGRRGSPVRFRRRGSSCSGCVRRRRG